jgi:hypothetical protein
LGGGGRAAHPRDGAGISYLNPKFEPKVPKGAVWALKKAGFPHPVFPP